MSPTPELTDPGRVEPLLTGAGHRMVARPVVVPPVATLRARSARRRRQRLWGATAGVALVLGAVGGATVALQSTSGPPVEVATASPGAGSSPTSASPTTTAPPTTAPPTSAPATTAPPTSAPAATAPPTSAALTPPTTPPPAAPTGGAAVTGPTPSAGDVEVTSIGGDAARVSAQEAAASADLTFEHAGLTVWLRLDGDDLTVSGSDGERFVRVAGSADELLLYVLFAQFELPLGLDAPLEELFEDQVLPEVQNRVEGGEVPGDDELRRLLDGVLDDLPQGVDVAPSPRQLQRFLRDLYKEVPELDDLLGRLPSREELRDQLDRLGPLVLPLDGLVGELDRQLQEALDGNVGRALDAVRDRLFGGGSQDDGDGEQQDGRGDDEGNGD